ncbi:MAG TPA: alkaline phosphatase PhoX, partial [Actinopolymorphaceae bacterium]|nr:alkaline phosphatase PhoX [Actinopolymorphaceae bacterium]
GLGIALVGSVDVVFGASAAEAAPAARRDGTGRPHRIGYGPLVDDPAGLLSLPAGFSYTLIAESGVTRLESGELTPSDPDGTASFARLDGGSVLVNNHEIDGAEPFPVPHLAGLVYDEQANGGTTNLEVDRHGNRVREYVSLAGTHNNCAGGPTPWDTWLTCEETEAVLGKPHGYVFEVDPHDRQRNREPKPIKALGRYAHEAVAVDPHEGRIYLTEDAGNPNGLLYRFTPPRSALPLRKGSLRALADDAGRLEALVATARGAVVPDLSVATEPGTTYRAQWVTVPDRDAATTPTRKQFADGQITRSRKLEGMWWADGGAYFVASFARPADGSAVAHDGQVWFHDPRRGTIELKLRFAYTPDDQDNDADGPDNITVSPFGGVILAEDGEGASHLVGATASGEAFFFARNDLNDSEFTGPNFSDSRKILFANIQTPGHVFAIQGPFTEQR